MFFLTDRAELMAIVIIEFGKFRNGAAAKVTLRIFLGRHWPVGESFKCRIHKGPSTGE